MAVAAATGTGVGALAEPLGTGVAVGVVGGVAVTDGTGDCVADPARGIGPAAVFALIWSKRARSSVSFLSSRTE